MNMTQKTKMALMGLTTSILTALIAMITELM